VRKDKGRGEYIAEPIIIPMAIYPPLPPNPSSNICFELSFSLKAYTATNAVMISGALFPIAKKVTPFHQHQTEKDTFIEFY
jgi:hypothetical protein